MITHQLNELIENNFDIGLKNYPIYKEEMREPLNNMIITHFYFREICCDTPALFKFYLNRKMSEIMRYYNQILKTEDLEFNPLYNIELTESFEHKTTTNNNIKGNSKINSTGNENVSNNTLSNNKNNSDNIAITDNTPASNMSMDDIKNNLYASLIEKNYDNVSSEEKSTINTNSTNSNNQIAENETKSIGDIIESYVKKTNGSSAGLSFSHAIKQWREIIINTFMMIIEELEVCFLSIY